MSNDEIHGAAEPLAAWRSRLSRHHEFLGQHALEAIRFNEPTALLFFRHLLVDGRLGSLQEVRIAGRYALFACHR